MRKKKCRQQDNFCLHLCGAATFFMTGSLVVERIFTIGGLGAKFVDCIINRDYPMIMGTTIFLATLMITMNLITDIVYKIVDPRIKLD